MTQMNISIKQKPKYRHGEETGGCEGGGGRGAERNELGVWISRCKLV